MEVVLFQCNSCVLKNPHVVENCVTKTIVSMGETSLRAREFQICNNNNISCRIFKTKGLYKSNMFILFLQAKVVHCMEYFCANVNINDCLSISMAAHDSSKEATCS